MIKGHTEQCSPKITYYLIYFDFLDSNKKQNFRIILRDGELFSYALKNLETSIKSALVCMRIKSKGFKTKLIIKTIYQFYYHLNNHYTILYDNCIIFMPRPLNQNPPETKHMLG